MRAHPLGSTLFLLAALVLSACAPAASPASPPATEAPSPSDTPPPQTEAPTEIATAAPTAAEAAPLGSASDCPRKTGTWLPFAHPEHGYCLLVPSGYVVETDGEATHFESKLYGGESEYVVISLRIAVEPASGRTTEAYAAGRLAEMSLEGVQVQQTAVALAGQQALMVTDIPSQMGFLNAFLVAGEMAYTFSLEPFNEDDQSGLDFYQDASALWQMVQDSLVIFPPQAGSEPTAGSSPPGCTPDSAFVADVTIPDGTIVVAGGSFIKVWRLRNDGTCDWGLGYELVQIGAEGDSLQAEGPAKVPLAAAGAEVEVHVKLALDASAPAQTSQAVSFQMRSPDGELFGSTPFVSILTASSAALGCPTAYGNLVLYVNEADGYCLLHPSDFTANYADFGDTAYLNGPIPQGEVEPLVVSLSIFNAGGVGGQTTQQFADAEIAAAQVPGSPPVLGSVTLDGEQAVTAEGLPGIMGTLQTFVVHDNRGYIFTLFPYDDAVPPEKAQAQQLWNAVVNSFTWIP